MTDQRRLIIIGGMLTLGSAAILASVATPAPHAGGDNAGYLSLAHALVAGEGYTEIWDPASPPHTKYPPVFPLLLGGLMLGGVSSWLGFKLVMAGLTSVSVLLVFVWVTNRKGLVFAAAVAVATILSGGWLDAGRWILSEPAFLVFTFLTLWAAERGGLGSIPWAGVAARDSNADPDRPRTSEMLWIALSGGAATAAVLTRTSGFPLLLALFGALLLARRLRAVVTLGPIVAVPILWWLLRSAGQGAYASEFWMRNPYEPAVGMIGWIDLPARAWANLRLYVGTVLPNEWWAVSAGATLGFLGVLLFTFASWGWVRRVRSAPGVVELFVPLYFGLILVWPEVWSGSRFLLPLLPFILVYAGESVLRIGRRTGSGGAGFIGAAAFLSVVLPALPGWLSVASEARVCRGIADFGDPFRCQGTGFVEFRDAAAWAGVNLSSDAVVLSRKPRIFFLLGGPPSIVFPFTRDAELFLGEADRAGATYLLLDHIDTVSLFYLPPVLSARPLAFCHVTGWRTGDGPGTELFRILPREERRPGGELRQLFPCSDSNGFTPDISPDIDGSEIPRIARSRIAAQRLSDSLPQIRPMSMP